jgi:hypothetical protein
MGYAQRQAHPTVRFNYMDVQYFYVRIKSEQIKHTWHDLCIVRDNYPKVHPPGCPPLRSSPATVALTAMPVPPPAF